MLIATRRPLIVARNTCHRRVSGASALRYANATLHFAASGPADVREREPQNALRTRVDGDFHLTALETGRRCVLRLLRQKPNVDQLRRRYIDLAWLAESFLQHADRLADVIRDDARHGTHGVSGPAATSRHQQHDSEARSCETQHIPLLTDVLGS